MFGPQGIDNATIANILGGNATPSPVLTVGMDEGYATPEMLAAQRKRAMDSLARGSDMSPVKGGWAEGLARVAQGALGGLEQRRANEMAERNQGIDNAAIARALSGDAPDYKALMASPQLRGSALQMMAQDAQAKRQDARDAQRHADQLVRLDQQQTFAERQAEAQRAFQERQLGEQIAARTAQQTEAAAARQEAARLQAELARGNRITYRPTTAEERQQFPGAVQVGSDGKFVFAPAEAIKQTAAGALGAAPADRAAQANALGVPDKLDVDPYAALSPKAKEERAKREQAAYVKETEKDRERREQLETQLADLDRFEQAEQRAGLSAVGRLAARLPGAGVVDSDIATMESVTAKVAPTIRAPGSGATSDYDAKQFERAVVGPQKPREANQQILSAYRGAAKNAMGFMDFKQAFMDTHGTTAGAERAWKRYLDANPIFDKEAGGTALNQNRMEWQDWFRQQNAQSKQGAPAGVAPARGEAVAGPTDSKPQGTAPKRLKFNPATGDFE